MYLKENIGFSLNNKNWVKFLIIWLHCTWCSSSILFACSAFQTYNFSSSRLLQVIYKMKNFYLIKEKAYKIRWKVTEHSILGSQSYHKYYSETWRICKVFGSIPHLKIIERSNWIALGNKHLSLVHMILATIIVLNF